MIALAPTPRSKSLQHAQFIGMLPTILHYAGYAFRPLDPEAREDAVAEVIAYSFVAYSRLAELSKTAIAYPTVLALYGIRRYWDGRRVGTQANRNDAYPTGSRRQHLGTPRDQRWMEFLTDNTKSPVVDQVIFRMDFPSWLQTLRERDRDVVLGLCQGDRPTEIARKHGLSRGRVSQLRRELHDDWQAFQGGEAGSRGRTSVAVSTASDAEKPVEPRSTQTDEARKEELLREAVAWDDLEDRIASMSDTMPE